MKPFRQVVASSSLNYNDHLKGQNKIEIVSIESCILYTGFTKHMPSQKIILVLQINFKISEIQTIGIKNFDTLNACIIRHYYSI